MSRKGPEVGMGMLDFVEDIFVGVKSPSFTIPFSSCCFPKKITILN